MNVPALAARAPLGATKTATGTGEARIALISSRIEVSSPPGVSIWRITSSAPSLAARSMPRFAKCALAGPMAPSSGTSITGAADATAQAQPRTANRIARIAADYAPPRRRRPIYLPRCCALCGASAEATYWRYDRSGTLPAARRETRRLTRPSRSRNRLRRPRPCCGSKRYMASAPSPNVTRVLMLLPPSPEDSAGGIAARRGQRRAAALAQLELHAVALLVCHCVCRLGGAQLRGLQRDARALRSKIGEVRHFRGLGVGALQILGIAQLALGELELDRSARLHLRVRRGAAVGGARRLELVGGARNGHASGDEQGANAERGKRGVPNRFTDHFALLSSSSCSRLTLWFASAAARCTRAF